MGAGESAMIDVVLYSRPGCHLCELVEPVLRHVQQRRRFALEIRNIDNSPGDYQRYRHEIPVVTVNGVEMARHQLTAAALDAALDAALEATPPSTRPAHRSS
jgi:hypothetical protein